MDRKSVRTCGFSATYLAQFRISLIASMLVSGNAALHANSDKHFTASWNESSVAAKYFSNIFAETQNIGTKIHEVLGILSPTMIHVDSAALSERSFIGKISASPEPLRNLVESSFAQQTIQKNRNKT